MPFNRRSVVHIASYLKIIKYLGEAFRGRYITKHILGNKKMKCVTYLELVSPAFTGFFDLPFFKYSFSFSALSKY